jgi:hypothetical protein
MIEGRNWLGRYVSGAVLQVNLRTKVNPASRKSQNTEMRAVPSDMRTACSNEYTAASNRPIKFSSQAFKASSFTTTAAILDPITPPTVM